VERADFFEFVACNVLFAIVAMGVCALEEVGGAACEAIGDEDWDGDGYGWEWCQVMVPESG
jgi:hypothetical protein